MKILFTLFCQRKINHLNLALNTGNCVLWSDMSILPVTSCLGVALNVKNCHPLDVFISMSWSCSFLFDLQH
jgi:hypothetical protein